MDFVFISSIQRDYADVREGVRRAIESLGLRPLMAEAAGASASSPQRALLDLVSRADVLLLILGPRYSKPTEDEFNEANRLGRPILVLRQAGEGDPDQQEFAERVAGGWSGGRLWGTFTDGTDVGFAAVQALTNLRNQGASAELQPIAQQQATERARGPQQRGMGGESVARIVHVPIIGEPLLDAVALDRPGIGDGIASLVREHGLVAQSIGIDVRITRAGIAVHQARGYAYAEPPIELAADGSVTATFNVAGDDQFGGMRVDPAKLQAGIEAGGRFARAAWDAVDDREAVQQVAVALAIPDAQHKVYGASTNRNSIQMGSFGMPNEVVVPDPARVVRRADIGSRQLSESLVAEVRRVFADARAVEK